MFGVFLGLTIKGPPFLGPGAHRKYFRESVKTKVLGPSSLLLYDDWVLKHWNALNAPKLMHDTFYLKTRQNPYPGSPKAINSIGLWKRHVFLSIDSKSTIRGDHYFNGLWLTGHRFWNFYVLIEVDAWRKRCSVQHLVTFLRLVSEGCWIYFQGQSKMRDCNSEQDFVARKFWN